MFRTKFAMSGLALAGLALAGLTLPGLMLPAAAQQGGKPAVASSGEAVVQNCVVSLIDEAEVPAKEAGVLMALDAKEGMAVKKDQLLAKLDDREQQVAKRVATYEFDVAREKAQNDVNVRFAIKSKEVAVEEYKAGLDIERRSSKAITTQELRRLELNAQKADLQIEVSNHEQTVAKITQDAREAQIEQADVAIDKRQILAPIDGEVVRVPRHVGEWLSPGDTVCRIVRMDVLRVEGYVESRNFAPQEIIGHTVTVHVDLARGLSTKLEGKIDYVSPLVEADGSYRVWTNLTNVQQDGHWVLRPGLTARMQIQVQPAGVAAR